ncbi:MAG TPA: energy transducer TonB [Terriglobales bacterium]|jgi:TonB family protein|nr:energy transducer TonB [Terriglobales bacterium]
MRRWTAIAVLALCWATLLSPNHSLAQPDPSEAKRKVVNRVVPVYPEMARTMNLKGIVRVEALVASNGSVKSVDVKGGHPLLVQAAENAIRKWKWEPAAHETSEPIEFKFDPQ